MTLCLDGIVFPERGRAALPSLRDHYLKETLRRFLAVGEALAPDWRAEHRRVARVLSRILSARPKPLLDCLAVPNVGAPIHSFFHRDRWPELSERIASAYRDCMPHLLLEAAVRRLLDADESFVWTAHSPALCSPTLQARLSPPAGASEWAFSNNVAAARGREREAFLRLDAANLLRGRREVRGLRSELAYIPLTEGVLLAFADPSPISETETHPEKSGNALNLGERSEDDWRSSLQTALSWIQESTPDLFLEMRSLGLQIVPIGCDAQRHCSASYQEAIGVIYMTLHPNPLVMAEALIHEFQHNKLNLASYRDAILDNAFEPLYRSPVRPDPRPLWGVLLAAHAFVPVAMFYRKLETARHSVSRTPEFRRRLLEIDRQNRDALETLEKNGRWTPEGARVWKELKAFAVRSSE